MIPDTIIARDRKTVDTWGDGFVSATRMQSHLRDYLGRMPDRRFFGGWRCDPTARDFLHQIDVRLYVLSIHPLMKVVWC